MAFRFRPRRNACAGQARFYSDGWTSLLFYLISYARTEFDSSKEGDIYFRLVANIMNDIAFPVNPKIAKVEAFGANILHRLMHRIFKWDIYALNIE